MGKPEPPIDVGKLVRYPKMHKYRFWIDKHKYSEPTINFGKICSVEFYDTMESPYEIEWFRQVSSDNGIKTYEKAISVIDPESIVLPPIVVNGCWRIVNAEYWTCHKWIGHPEYPGFKSIPYGAWDYVAAYDKNGYDIEWKFIVSCENLEGAFIHPSELMVCDDTLCGAECCK